MDFACLEEYVENFRQLIRRFPEAWHLNVQAEGRYRGETLQPAFARGERSSTWKKRGHGFLPHAPWADEFREAARDKPFFGMNTFETQR